MEVLLDLIEAIFIIIFVIFAGYVFHFFGCGVAYVLDKILERVKTS